MKSSVPVQGRSARAAFSVLEMMIAVTILALLAGALSLAIRHMRGMASTSGAQSTLQDSAERAMRRIAADLARSGDLDVGGGYPYLFEDGAAVAPFDVHAHAPATHQAVAGDPDFGPNVEIVFLLPQESDPPGSYGNDIPDIDANANLIWDASEFSYVLVTGVDGVNYLQRRVNGANPVTIASNVERVAFEDDQRLPGVIPVDSVRVQLFFRKLDSQGVLHRHRAEQIVKLRNGV